MGASTCVRVGLARKPLKGSILLQRGEYLWGSLKGGQSDGSSLGDCLITGKGMQ